MKQINSEILIIGAGAAGLACAMELAKVDRNITIIEKDQQVGGLAKTLVFQEDEYTFRTDLGPHRFFSKNQYLYDFIAEIIPEEWKLVDRNTRQFINGKFYNYPINAIQVLKNIGPFKSLEIIKDYCQSLIQFYWFKKEIKTFEDYVVIYFGRALAEFSIINYTEKIWGIPVKEIHPDWAKQRIKGLNLFSVFKNSLFIKNNNPKSLVDQFYYPQFGTGLIYEKITQKLEQMGNELYTDSYPIRIHHSNYKIVEVEAIIKGCKQTIRPKHLVESIPITKFLSLLNPSPPKLVIEAANSLRWRSQIYLFITLDKAQVTKDNWIYFPNKEIPFGRISEMKNFSKDMSPTDKTSLFVEFFVFEDDNMWLMSEEKVFEMAMPYFEKFGFFHRHEVRKYYLLKRKHVYPIYDMYYQKHLEVIKEYLDLFINLTYIGRLGRFKYTNQDHSLEMGILAAQNIINGKKTYTFDNIGAENEYFEKGRIYDKRI